MCTVVAPWANHCYNVYPPVARYLVHDAQDSHPIFGGMELLLIMKYSCLSTTTRDTSASCGVLCMCRLLVILGSGTSSLTRMTYLGLRAPDS